MIAWQIISRVCLLVATFILSLWGATPFEIFLKTFINFQETNGFFGFTFSSAILGFFLSWVFLSGLILFILGKKLDYFFFGTILLFTVFIFIRTPNVTLSIYFSLILTTLAGIIIGYILKLARQKFFG